MKKIFITAVALGLSVATQAQLSISFESSEGYVLGDINGQGNDQWILWDIDDLTPANQIVTDEKATDGTFSFKNGFEPEIVEQPFAQVGPTFFPDEFISVDGLTISYDILIGDVDLETTSLFEFFAYDLDFEAELILPIVGLGFVEGISYVYNDIDFEDVREIENFTWETEQWYNIKFKFKENTIEYYINDELVFTGDNYNPIDIPFIDIVHDNFGGDAYYDNIKFTYEDEMGVRDLTSTKFSIYPNPAKDVISISSQKSDQIISVDLYQITGKKLKSVPTTQNIDVQSLPKGTYILRVTHKDGSVQTQKFLKL